MEFGAIGTPLRLLALTGLVLAAVPCAAQSDPARDRGGDTRNDGRERGGYRQRAPDAEQPDGARPAAPPRSFGGSRTNQPTPQSAPPAQVARDRQRPNPTPGGDRADGQQRWNGRPGVAPTAVSQDAGRNGNPSAQALRGDRSNGDRSDGDRRAPGDQAGWRGTPDWRGGDRDDRNRPAPPPSADRDRWRGDDRHHDDNGWRGGDDRRDGDHYAGDRHGDWNRDWRGNGRYDWRGYRDDHHDVFRLGRYYTPYRDWSYRRLTVGFTLQPLFFGSSYWIGDPFYYRLPPAYGPFRWVRYYDDALLVNVYTGEVVDTIYDIFW